MQKCRTDYLFKVRGKRQTETKTRAKTQFSIPFLGGGWIPLWAYHILNLTVIIMVVIFCCFCWHLDIPFDIANAFFSVINQNTTINTLASRSTYSFDILLQKYFDSLKLYHQWVGQIFIQYELGVQTYNICTFFLYWPPPSAFHFIFPNTAYSKMRI